MTVTAIAFGSNMGDKNGNMVRGLSLLSATLRVTAKSPLYQTEPVGYTDQDWFLNGVVLADTILHPLELLDLCQSIEATLGRRREIHWGPRSLDLDILVYGDAQIRSPRLEIPHPLLHRRLFVLQPLADVYPDGTVPGLGVVSALLSAYDGEEKIRIYTEGKW